MLREWRRVNMPLEPKVAGFCSAGHQNTESAGDVTPRRLRDRHFVRNIQNDPTHEPVNGIKLG